MIGRDRRWEIAVLQGIFIEFIAIGSLPWSPCVREISPTVFDSMESSVLIFFPHSLGIGAFKSVWFQVFLFM